MAVKAHEKGARRRFTLWLSGYVLIARDTRIQLREMVGFFESNWWLASLPRPIFGRR